MVCDILQLAPLEAEKEAEVSLRQAFELHAQKLKPPFIITNLTPVEYLQLNQALVYGILCQPDLARVHLKHLHGIVSDGYACFVDLVVKIVNELYVKLAGEVKIQLILVVKEMIDVCGVGIDVLVLSLLRRIGGGDFSDGNLWLCYEMVSLLCEKWEWLVDEEPLVVPSALFVFLRVLCDHCRESVDAKVAAMRRKEIEFCVRLLREKFYLCIKIGRELIRMLRDLGFVPEFRGILDDLLLRPAVFGIPGFSDIMQIYRMRTSSRYFLLRVTPEMEAELRFLLTYVGFGNQGRYLEWFSRKFLIGPDKEVLICDIVRFICCAHHPSNKIIQSPIIPRWAVLGWLLKYCEVKYEVANFKLALFYDWLFFDEGSDNIMNIEPAMLLMVHSIPQYVEVTHTLLEYLIFLMESYDIERKTDVASGVMSAFNTLVKKGVVRSLDVLTSCTLLHPGLTEKLHLLLKPPGPLVPCVMSSISCRVEPENSALVAGKEPHCLNKDQYSQESKEALGKPLDVQVNPCIPIKKENTPFNAIKTIYGTFRDNISKSHVTGLQTLADLLNLLAKLDYENLPKNTVEALFDKISKDFESNGHKLFSLHNLLLKDVEGDFDVQSATALILRKLILSPIKGMLEIFFFFSREGLPVRALILLYSLRLVYEIQIGRTENLVSDELLCSSDPRIALLKFHMDEHIKLKKENQQVVISKPDSNRSLLDELLAEVFTAYQSFLAYSKAMQENETDGTLVELLAYDLLSCFEWDGSGLSHKIGIVFSFLPDLSVGQEVIIRLLVIQLSHTEIVDIQFQLGVKKYVVFGNNTESILLIVKNSLGWDSSIQHKLWGLLRSELAVSYVKIERLTLEFFGSDFLDPKISSIAVEGFLTLCCCHGPTPELVGAIMLLPNNDYKGFSAAVLSTWARSSSSSLLACLVEFLEKLQNTNNGSLLSDSRIMLNQSATSWMLNYCNATGVRVDILRKLALVAPVNS